MQTAVFGVLIISNDGMDVEKKLFLKQGKMFVIFRLDQGHRPDVKRNYKITMCIRMTAELFNLQFPEPQFGIGWIKPGYGWIGC